MEKIPFSIVLAAWVAWCGVVWADETFEFVDLRAMTGNVKAYRVKDATLEHAVVELFKAAGQSEYAESVRVYGPEKARVSLDLENTPVTMVLTYLTELSGCYPVRIMGMTGGPAADVYFDEVTEIDDSSLFLHLVSYPLTKDGARRLGIREGMSVKEVTTLFRGFGVALSDDKAEVVWWNAETENLSVRAYRQTLSLPGAIAALANAGYRPVKDSD